MVEEGVTPLGGAVLESCRGGGHEVVGRDVDLCEAANLMGAKRHRKTEGRTTSCGSSRHQLHSCKYIA